jgi:outer membrane protein TolC
MGKSKWLFVSLIFGILYQIGPAQSKFDLITLIDRLKKNNLLLKISELDQKIAREEYRSAKSLPNPELEYSRGQGDLIDGSDSRELWGLGLKLSIPNPILRHYLVKSAKGTVIEAIIQREIRKRYLIKLLKKHFYRLQLSKKLKDITRERILIMDEVLKITRAKVDIGESKEIDFLRISVEKQKLTTLLFKLEKSISVEKMKINELLDFTLPGYFEIEVDFDFTPFLDSTIQITHLIEKSAIVEMKKNG